MVKNIISTKYDNKGDHNMQLFYWLIVLLFMYINDQIVEKQVDSCSFIWPMARLIYKHRHLDFFHLTNTSNNLVYDENKGKYYKKRDVYPTLKCKYMGLQTWCPNNKKALLELVYGNLNSTRACIDGKWAKI